MEVSLDKNFTKPSYLCIVETFGGINFHECDEGYHILHVEVIVTDLALDHSNVPQIQLLI